MVSSIMKKDKRIVNIIEHIRFEKKSTHVVKARIIDEYKPPIDFAFMLKDGGNLPDFIDNLKNVVSKLEGI